MSFRSDFPDYNKYEDGRFFYSEIPPGVVSALKGLILRVAKSPQHLKAICNDIASRIPCEPTQNWGLDWLVNDLDSMLDQLARKKMHKFMDFLHDLTQAEMNAEFTEDLNDIFEEYDFGYRIVLEPGFRDHYYWELHKEPERVEETVSIAVQETRDACAQATNHLEQARDQLQKSSDNQRAIKDALRDCLSAMEALVKELSNEADLRAAISALRADGHWGPAIILKDGLGIWDRIHDLYPDVRHGHPEVSQITKEEGLYWIDRLMAYVNYLARRRRTFSRS